MRIHVIGAYDSNMCHDISHLKAQKQLKENMLAHQILNICIWTLAIALGICNLPLSHMFAREVMWERERGDRVVLVYAFWIKFNKIYCFSAAVSPPLINEWKKERQQLALSCMLPPKMNLLELIHIHFFLWLLLLHLSFFYISVSWRNPLLLLASLPTLNWEI